MDEILAFQSVVWDDGDYQDTIEGEDFRALMDLCFHRADKFSLLRRDWPGAKDGPLEQALRPYILGEYFSYGHLRWFGHEAREKCYIYPANQETKAIFLAHITHLFGRDVERPDGSHWPPEKYKACVETSEAAYERVMERVEAEENIFGPISDEDFAAIETEELREAREIWLQVFDEADFQSNLEDPCFFRGTTCSSAPSPTSWTVWHLLWTTPLGSGSKGWESGWTSPTAAICGPWASSARGRGWPGTAAMGKTARQRAPELDVRAPSVWI